MKSSASMHVFRLPPKADLKKSILQFALDHSVKAGVIVTCVGSLEHIHLRFANQKEGTKKSGSFEIVSLTGTFSASACHLHVSVSDSSGVTLGGHLLDENIIYTTGELCVAVLEDIRFERQEDQTYGFLELVVKSNAS